MRKGADIKMKGIISMLAVICLGIWGSTEVHAQETGMIQLECRGTLPNQQEVVFQGAKFVLYQVGQPTEAGWELTEEFSMSQIPLGPTDASGQRERAKLLWKYTKEKKLDGVTGQTDKNGMLSFSNLRDGIYLIGQTEAYLAEGGSFVSAPFLISMPVTENGTFLYKIEVRPKSEWEGEADIPVTQKPNNTKPGTSVVTGDSTDPAPYCVLALLSLTVFLAGGKRK